MSARVVRTVEFASVAGDEWLMLGGTVAGGVAGLLSGSGATGLVVGLAVGGIGSAASLVDVRERRIPNRLVVAVAIAAAVAGLLVHLLDGRASGGLLAGAAAGGVPLLVVHLVQPAGLGFGDVKYGAAMGALIGVLDWRMAAVMLTVASPAAALSGLVVTAWRRSCPYGLMLTGGALLALTTGRYL